jgi:hypothetical protein
VNAADMFARWDDYDQLPEANRNAIDDMRWVPVMETRYLLTKALIGTWYGGEWRTRARSVGR